VLLRTQKYGLKLLEQLDKKMAPFDEIVSALSVSEAKTANDLLDKLRNKHPSKKT
jgi:ABC-type oligopeptide transport system ATPase subunit